MNDYASAYAGTYRAIVIGAGQAGVSVSYCLGQRDVDHLVLEKDRPFADWYRHRWDSFTMNTPNWMNVLPGEKVQFAPQQRRDQYGTLKDALVYFEQYLRDVCPPLHLEGVTSVGLNRDGSWRVETDHAVYRANNVIICTGHAGKKRVPAIAQHVSSDVPQLHSSEYQHPAQITTSNVLIVGSGSSGVQICHELASSGKFATVYFATSGNGTLPWTVFGIPTYDLIRRLGLFKLTRESWFGRHLFAHLQKKADPATPPSPRQLARRHRVQLVGRVTSAGATQIHCGDGQTVPLENLTIVWCTGFQNAFDFLDVYVRDGMLDRHGFPMQRRGVVEKMPGLYFVGLRYQHTFVSQDLYGVGQDAEYVADHISRRHVNESHRRSVLLQAISGAIQL